MCALKFESIRSKRKDKNFRSMSIVSAAPGVIQRKCLASLALPVLTHNGMIRSVDGPLGNALLKICGFNYKQSTMNKYFSELKYLGISDSLLREQVGFWKSYWHNHSRHKKMELPILCYYVDGNTKAYWSNQNVKQNIRESHNP